jgi:hypothetical protein
MLGLSACRGLFLPLSRFFSDREMQSPKAQVGLRSEYLVKLLELRKTRVSPPWFLGAAELTAKAHDDSPPVNYEAHTDAKVTA